jgi:hypothetical protein
LCDIDGTIFDGSYSINDNKLSEEVAIATRKGRALPVMVEATYALQIPTHSPMPSKQKLRAAMKMTRRTQSFTGHAIDSL